MGLLFALSNTILTAQLGRRRPQASRAQPKGQRFKIPPYFDRVKNTQIESVLQVCGSAAADVEVRECNCEHACGLIADMEDGVGG